MIEGYELSKYLDPVTVRIMNFIHKARCLYTCTEDNNSKVATDTLYKYLDALCSTFIINKVFRYDVEGKNVLKSL